MVRLKFQVDYQFPCRFFKDTSFLKRLENLLSKKKTYVNEACSNCEFYISILHNIY